MGLLNRGIEMGLAKTMLKDGKLVRVDQIGEGWPPDEGVNICDGTFMTDGIGFFWDLVMHTDEDGNDVWGIYVIETGDSGKCRSDVTSITSSSTMQELMTLLWRMATDITRGRKGG